MNFLIYLAGGWNYNSSNPYEHDNNKPLIQLEKSQNKSVIPEYCCSPPIGSINKDDIPKESTGSK